MKITKRDIKSAHVLSHSPLVVQVVHTDGSSNSYSTWQMSGQMTAGAAAKVREIIKK